ncbi:aminotransferase class V-fold PLP-dependent enzyme [Cohnella thailandensis]|uniref:cysteine desulfurase n=1 Tax=Cohnella thailandensis TaxID=557557 RepID=A0A841STX1_9BACL|nr:aminotransferase class V-fold PLP-dependent enzyme [Cohnella thailandensis]MBB6634046.1 aminotransferase class V-fold PLP-dependent enzyme [Cohnella thailandensis]MBP1972462.1 cysteine desulfurase family protein [Cohnella thailandensis]
MSESIIYLDNAATSWPKPPSVQEAMETCMREAAANPGRGSHRMAVQASRVLFEGRKQLAKLFRIANPNDIAFTLNTTHSLNTALQGWLKPGDHVITTALEHNSIRRPLEALRRKIGIQITYAESNSLGVLDAGAIEREIRPNTTLIAVTHSSNLLGTITPVGEIGQIARRRGVKLLVDAAQSAGVLDIDVEAMGIDMLAFPGHKGLMGPQGTGGLYLHPDLELEPLMHGGTGSASESPEQPSTRPDRYEAGTPNTVGIAGLTEGVKFVLDQTPAQIHRRELELTRKLMEGLSEINGVTLLGPGIHTERTAIVSYLLDNVDPAAVAFQLDRQYGIAVRAGFHCTPLGHQTIGTTDTGAVRASPGYFTTESDIVSLIDATRELVLAHGKSHRL